MVLYLWIILFINFLKSKKKLVRVLRHNIINTYNLSREEKLETELKAKKLNIVQYFRQLSINMKLLSVFVALAAISRLVYCNEGDPGTKMLAQFLVS